MGREEKEQKWRSRWIFILCLVLALLVAGATIALHQSKYFGSGELHAVEVVRQLSGNNLVSAVDNSEQISEREKLFQTKQADGRDIAAWLTIPKTGIDYPVMHTQDRSYYLEHNMDQQVDVYGAPFLDPDNAPDFSDAFSLVHAINMSNGTMFGSLRSFREEKQFSEIPQGILVMSDGVHRVTFFCCAVLSDTVQNLLRDELAQQSDVRQFAEALKDAAEQWRDVELAEDDCLIALASCDVSGDWSESATVLIGRIEKVEETSE